ncbi:MAG: hypothetical protein IMX01_07510 [Limnochordaceae bacterium]|nr:hypothetical protein [Limnochordaceae bacterium]
MQTKRVLSLSLSLALAVSGVLLGGAGLTWADEAAAPAVAILDLEPTQAVVGQMVQVTGSGFAPGTTVQLLWETYDGHWELSRNAQGEYTGTSLGPRFTPSVRPLGEEVVADATGRFATRFAVPEDYGGVHNILAVPAAKAQAALTQAGLPGEAVITQAGLRVLPSVTYAPTTGPVGTLITITIKGLNSPHEVEGWYQLLYDNKLTGSISGVTTRGTAMVTIPATGDVGMHYIDIQNGPFGSPYRALESSPYAYMPVFRLSFRITPGEPVLPPPPSQQVPAPRRGVEPAGQGPAIWFDPQEGAVGTPATLYGKGFAPGAKVSLEIYGQYGSRVTPEGFRPVSQPLLTVTADREGRIEQSLSLPDTHGGYHRVGAWVEGKELATTGLTIDRTPFSFGPAGSTGDQETGTGAYPRVSQGTLLDLHLKGVGWTETENIFAIVYDNSFVGYSCGFSTFGDVVTYLTATGGPGWHFIDLYPSFYRNEKYAEAVEAPFLYRFPLLSWKDHPQPFVLHYAFEIVDEAGTKSKN